jgi:hypothetical protein
MAACEHAKRGDAAPAPPRASMLDRLDQVAAVLNYLPSGKKSDEKK